MRRTFLYGMGLQALDALTTVIFLKFGIPESNPGIRFILRHYYNHDPLMVLLGFKLLWLIPATYFVLRDKIIIWNLGWLYNFLRFV